MTAILALAPCAVILCAIFVLRFSALSAAACAMFSALVLWGMGIFAPSSADQLGRAVVDALVLELLVGVVIFFGLLFVEMTWRDENVRSIDDTIRALDLSPAKTVILVTLGIGVTLESLTGYGVSMLVTVPLLIRIVPRNRAITLALLGMSLMAWGALSVAALLGAELAGLSSRAMGQAIVTTSGPVAALLPLACWAVTPGSRPRDAIFALWAGAALCGGIWTTSSWFGAELAGVGGGLAVIAFTLCFVRSKSALSEAAIMPILRPFATLIAVVAAQKLIAPFVTSSGFTPEIATNRVTFRVLESPGLALFIVILANLVLEGRTARMLEFIRSVKTVIHRSWRVLASLMLFLTTARLLVETGGIDELSGLLIQSGKSSIALAVVLLGGIGAYATGSGITSNALFMASAAAIGKNVDAISLFAALQHSAASHAAMAALPVIALLVAALPDCQSDDTRRAMRSGLILAGLWTIAVATSGLVQLHWPS